MLNIQFFMYYLRITYINNSEYIKDYFETLTSVDLC